MAILHHGTRVHTYSLSLINLHLVKQNSLRHTDSANLFEIVSPNITTAYKVCPVSQNMPMTMVIMESWRGE